MKEKIKKIFKMNHASKNKISLGQKMRLYLWMALFITVSVGIVFIITAGGFVNEKKSVKSHLHYELAAVDSDMEKELGEYEGYGLSLARALGQILDNELYGGTVSVSVLNDDSQRLLELQEKMYFELNTTMQMGGSSGVFVVLDATTNTSAPTASHSRSGLYIRLRNFSDDIAFKQEYSFFRGISDIAHAHGMQMNNHWDLEFDINKFPHYEDMLQKKNSSGERFFWTERIHLDGMCEDVILLCFPIYSAQNTVYGVCGIELSALYFHYRYPARSSKYGHSVVALAPQDDSYLYINAGLVGGTDGTWLEGEEQLKYRKSKYFNIYTSATDMYYGVTRTIDMPNLDDTSWVIAVLIPQKGCRDLIGRAHIKHVILFVIFGVFMVFLSVWLSKKFVRPIQQGVEDIQQSGRLPSNTFGIAEFDALIEFLNDTKQEDSTPTQTALPDGVEELFERFIKGVDQLSKAEYRVFKCYMDGYQVAQVPEVAFISMSTVKKHNRSIYEKLEVSSYDELMLYLDMLERCGKYEQVVRDDEESGG